MTPSRLADEWDDDDFLTVVKNRKPYAELSKMIGNRHSAKAIKLVLDACVEYLKKGTKGMLSGYMVDLLRGREDYVRQYDEWQKKQRGG